MLLKANVFDFLKMSLYCYFYSFYIVIIIITIINV